MANQEENKFVLTSSRHSGFIFMDTNIAFTINIPVRGKNAQTQAKYAEELVAADKQGFLRTHNVCGGSKKS